MHEADQRMAAVMLELASLMLQGSFELLQSSAVVPYVSLPAMRAGHEFRDCGVSLVLAPFSGHGDDRDGRARKTEGSQDTRQDGSSLTQASLRVFLRFLNCFTGDVIQRLSHF
jgi:hypothetical protein